MDIKKELEKFIIEEICPEQEIDLSEIQNDYPLIDNMVIDSLGILRILSFLDEDLDIDISDIEVVYENFKDLNAIENAVKNSGQ